MMRTLNRHKNKKGRRFSRSLLSLGIIIFIILTYRADALSVVSIADYTAYPPFAGTLFKPNVLINLDTSTSLSYFAYDFNWNAQLADNTDVPPSQGFDPTENYYGYFEPSQWYIYDTLNGEWTTENATTADWKGSFLNWLTMRRTDIIKKALIGGKTKYRAGMIIDSTDAHAHDLVAEPPYSDSSFVGYQKVVLDSVLCGVSPLEDMGMSTCLDTESTTFTFNNTDTITGEGNGRRWWETSDIPAFSIGVLYDPTDDKKVAIHLDIEPEGIIQRVGDNVRWGLEVMNNGLFTTEGHMGHGGNHKERDETSVWEGNRYVIRNVNGGTVLVPIGYDNIDDKEVIEDGVTVTLRGMVTEIAIAAPYTPATPLAESLWTATGYFMQYEPQSDYGPRYFIGATDRGQWGRGGRWGPRSTAASYPVGNDVDPYNYANDPLNDVPLWVPCAQCFVITITDGEPTKDENIDTTMLSDAFSTTYTDSTSRLPGWEGTDYFWLLGGSHYVDEVALYGHADPGTSYRDLRADLIIDTDGDGIDNASQNLTHYFIYANFGGGTPDGERLLNYSIAAGGGAARNGGFIDSNGDFLPDLQDEYDVLRSGNNDNFFEAENGHHIEAALTSALFDIVNRASSGTAAGMLANTADGEGAVYQAYFLTKKEEGTEFRKWLGYMQALFLDRNGNLREDSNNDDVLDSGDNIIKMGYSPENGTEVYKCSYTNETLNIFTCPGNADDLDSITPLWEGGKSLWSTDPAARKILATINGSTLLDGEGFHTDNSLDLTPYLRAADTVEADNIINWIRGEDISGYRKRDLTINGVNKVWKLGDIIHSTPTVVGKPMENYDLLYGDSSYTGFRSNYLRRRQVVYAGANDGMLHAFNAGCYNAAERKYYPDVDSSGNCISDTHSLGQELWAFVPRGLLPHLKWLTDPGYTHVYYVDLKPKITDVKIFSADTTHVNGWGTILIGGFRYGGKDINWTSGLVDYTASPEYFALDITDPLNPKLLWTFSAPDLGLSMTYPSVAKVGENWYAIFGSGATDYDATSNLTGFQSGNVFVLNISGGTDGVIETWTEDTNFWKKATDTGITTAFMSDPITVDVDIDYDVDVIYLGENYNDVNWNAILHRITTSKGTQTNPADWTISTVGNISDISAYTGGNDVTKRITAAPSAAMDDGGNLWVFFGTGEFLGASDKNQTDSGAFYAIKDGCWAGVAVCTTSYTNLMDMSSASVNIDGTVTVGATIYPTWQEFLNASSAYSGWTIYFNARGEAVDFTGEVLNRNGERVVTKPFVLGGLVIWATYIPDDNPCSYEGESNLYAVYYKTGTAYQDYIFSEQRDAAVLVAGGETSTYDIDEVARVKKLGGKIGMPSTLSAGVTTSGTVKGFAGQSTGSILEIEVDSPISLKSEIINWSDRPIP